jgi:hypothetical protein
VKYGTIGMVFSVVKGRAGLARTVKDDMLTGKLLVEHMAKKNSSQTTQEIHGQNLGHK